jgi:hypothetical protein
MKREHSALFAACAAVFATTSQCFAQGSQLAPPAPMGPYVAPSPSQADEARRRQETLDLLRRGAAEDSGRSLSLFWAKAGVGVSHLGLAALSEDKLGLGETSGTGPVIDFGAGVRLVAFTLGARARLHALSNVSLWNIGANAAFHLPLNPIEPYIGLHAGYVFSGGVSASAVPAALTPKSSDVSLRGLGAGLSAGADYFVVPLFSLGLDVSVDTYFLNRKAIAATGSPSGSAVGFGVSGAVRLGLHL